MIGFKLGSFCPEHFLIWAVLQVEDHYPEGGIGDAVLDAVADLRNVVVKKLAVNAVPRSGGFVSRVYLRFNQTCTELRPSHGTAGDVRHLCQLHRQGSQRVGISLRSRWHFMKTSVIWTGTPD